MHKAINKVDELVGKGVYVSPYFVISLLDYSNLQTDKKFAVVLQILQASNRGLN
jgi:hypothetical protein